MRRLIVQEPVTRAALWSRRTAWFAVAVAAIAVALLNLRLVEIRAGLTALASGFFVAIVAIGFAFVAFVRIWREGRRGLGLAIRSLFVAAALLAYPGYLLVLGLVQPVPADVTTDLEVPPTFSRSQAAFAVRDGIYPPDPETREAQREAHPDIVPLSLDLEPRQAYALALKAAERRGWRIVEAVLPGGRSGLGRIDALDLSPVLRLPDDVTVRLTPRADGTILDIRSASRHGPRDFGRNASRIRRYLEDVAALAAAASE